MTWPRKIPVQAGFEPGIFRSRSRHLNHQANEAVSCSMKTGSKVCLFVGCSTFQQHASVSQGRICLHNFTCCHTELEVADPTFHFTQSQYTDTGPTSPSTGEAIFKSLVWLNPGKIWVQARFELGIFHSQGGRLNRLANEAVSLMKTGSKEILVTFNYAAHRRGFNALSLWWSKCWLEVG